MIEQPKMIEQLKHNKACFGELSTEEQEVFKKVGSENCLVRHQIIWRALPSDAKFYHNFTYRIRSDYQPEPEYIDLEVIENFGWLGVESAELPEPSCQFTHIQRLPSLPGFVCFWWEDEKERRETRIIGEVANQRRHEKKVYARIEKNIG